jgi:hypothetical protein
LLVQGIELRLNISTRRDIVLLSARAQKAVLLRRKTASQKERQEQGVASD